MMSADVFLGAPMLIQPLASYGLTTMTKGVVNAGDRPDVAAEIETEVSWHPDRRAATGDIGGLVYGLPAAEWAEYMDLKEVATIPHGRPAELRSLNRRRGGRA